MAEYKLVEKSRLIFNVLEKNKKFFSDLLHSTNKKALLDEASNLELKALDLIVKKVCTKDPVIVDNLDEVNLQKLSRNKASGLLRDWVNLRHSETKLKELLSKNPKLIDLILIHFVEIDSDCTI